MNQNDTTAALLEVGFCYMHSGLLKCGTNGIQFGCLGQSRREQSTFFSPSLYDVSLSLCMEPPSTYTPHCLRKNHYIKKIRLLS